MYSRRIKVEETKNKRSAAFFILLTIVSLALLYFWGVPAIARFAALLSEITSTSDAPREEDTTPPPPPRIEALPKATNQAKIEVKGTTEAGSDVILTLNGKSTEVIADISGQFSFNLNLSKGENTISLIAKDTAGNESRQTEVYKVNYDTEPPELEISKPAEGSEFFGSKQRQIVIEGKTESGAKVQINNRLVVVDSDGSFALTTTLTDGQNVFSVKAEDEAGNVTEKSLTVSFSS